MSTDKQPELVTMPERKQALETMVSANTANLLNIEPNNPAVRALVLRQTGLNIPAELTTFAGVKQWMESQDLPKHAVAVKPLKLAVSTYGDEWGTCSFRRGAYGNGHVTLTPELIREIAEESEDLDDLRERISEHIADEARENIERNNFENRTESEVEITSTDNFSADYNRGLLSDYVKNILTRDEWRRLEGVPF